MKKFIKNNFTKNYIISISEIISRIPLIFTVGYLASNIGPEVFGAWSLVLVVQALSVSISGAGFTSALIRYVPNASKDDAYQFLFLSIKRSAFFLLIISILIYIFYDFIGSLLNIDKEYRWLLIATCVMAIGSIMDGLLDKYFKARILITKQILYLFTRTVAEVVSVIVVFNFLDFSHASSALLSYILIVVVFKIAIYPWLFLDRRSSIKEKIKLNAKNSFLKFSYLLLPSALLAWLIIQIDRIILGWMLDSSEFGVYAFSATLASYLVFLSYSIMPLFQSHAAKFYDQGRFQDLQNLFEIWQYMFISAASILLLLLVFFSQEILYFTGGTDFAGLPNILLILSAAVCIDQFFGQYELIFSLANKPKLITLVYVIKLFLMIIFIPIFAYFFGIYGAVLGIIISVIIVNLFRYANATKLIAIKLTFFLKMYIVILIALILILSQVQNLSLITKSFFSIILVLIISLIFFKDRKKISYIED
jgi:O-antigen/teichoic acid export membrane protein